VLAFARMSDQVRLAMPANPEFLRLARVTAMGIASRLGFTLDDIEDLRIAIDELCFALMGTAGRPGLVQLVYRVQDEGLEVLGQGEFDDEGPSRGLSELSELILAAVTDEHELRLNGASSSFRLVKRRTGTG
jgi:serine/threonine-protein kinase RsbW